LATRVFVLLGTIVTVLVLRGLPAGAQSSCDPLDFSDGPNAALGQIPDLEQSDPAAYQAEETLASQCAANGTSNTVGCEQQEVTIVLNAGYTWNCGTNTWQSAVTTTAPTNPPTTTPPAAPPTTPPTTVPSAALPHPIVVTPTTPGPPPTSRAGVPTTIAASPATASNPGSKTSTTSIANNPQALAIQPLSSKKSDEAPWYFFAILAAFCVAMSLVYRRIARS
jgi:hypothetical protein